MESKFDACIDLLQSEFRSEIKHLDQRLVDSVETRLERQLEAIFKPELPPPPQPS